MPPPAMITGACVTSWFELPDHLNDRLHMVYGSFRENSVSEVKDMTGAGSRAAQEFMHANLELGHWSEEDHRVEIALNGSAIADVHPCLIDVEAPVDTHNIAAGSVQFPELSRRAGAEMDYGYAIRANAFDQGASGYFRELH